MLQRLFSLVLGATGWWLFIRIATLIIAMIAVSHLIPARFHYAGRRTWSVLLPGWVISLIACVAVLAGFSYLVGTPPRVSALSSARSSARKQLAPSPDKPAPKWYLGVYEPGEFTSYQNVVNFGAAVGQQPSIVLYYSAWNAPFQTQFAVTALSHGAMTFVDIEPVGVSVAAIAQGRYDSYLRSYARQVRAYGHPVALSFAPEANGSWDSWGWTHTSPKTWVAAWRHIVDVFRQQGASNVIWVWVMNRQGSGNTGPLSAYWPGSGYVTWVGIDGYYFTPPDTFQRNFAPTISAIRRFASKPIILSEVGVGQVAGQARKIPDLFAGIRKYHLIGLVWFDSAQHGGPYRQDWRLEGHGAALAAFRRGVASLAASGG